MISKHENRLRAKEWYKNNKDKVKERNKINSKIRSEYGKKWRNENKEKVKENEKEYRKLPWVKTYVSIVSRCSSNPFYVKKGIKNLIGVKQLKFIWFRDKAYKMTKPTIDRIDRNKGYSLGNCRYLELSDNLKRRKF